jgi:hypothetical protein
LTITAISLISPTWQLAGTVMSTILLPRLLPLDNYSIIIPLISHISNCLNSHLIITSFILPTVSETVEVVNILLHICKFSQYCRQCGRNINEKLKEKVKKKNMMENEGPGKKSKEG